MNTVNTVLIFDWRVGTSENKSSQWWLKLFSSQLKAGSEPIDQLKASDPRTSSDLKPIKPSPSSHWDPLPHFQRPPAARAPPSPAPHPPMHCRDGDGCGVCIALCGNLARRYVTQACIHFRAARPHQKQPLNGGGIYGALPANWPLMVPTQGRRRPRGA